MEANHNIAASALLGLNTSTNNIIKPKNWCDNEEIYPDIDVLCAALQDPGKESKSKTSCNKTRFPKLEALAKTLFMKISYHYPNGRLGKNVSRDKMPIVGCILEHRKKYY